MKGRQKKLRFEARASYRTDSLRENMSKYPAIAAGKHAKTPSVYTDENGKQVIIPQGWTVSAIKSENTIDGETAGLVIYKIPEEEVNTVNWEDEAELKKFNIWLWVPSQLIRSNGTLSMKVLSKKFGKNIQRKETYWLILKCREETKMFKEIHRSGGFYL